MIQIIKNHIIRHYPKDVFDLNLYFRDLLYPISVTLDVPYKLIFKALRELEYINQIEYDLFSDSCVDPNLYLDKLLSNTKPKPYTRYDNEIIIGFYEESYNKPYGFYTNEDENPVLSIRHKIITELNPSLEFSQIDSIVISKFKKHFFNVLQDIDKVTEIYVILD